MKSTHPKNNEGSDEAWSCPVSFVPPSSDPSPTEKVHAEIMLLQPWYDRGKASRSYTSVGLSGLEMSVLVQYFGDLLAVGTVAESPCPELSTGDAIKCCAEDLKAFYYEATTSQPDNITLYEAENWYWGNTHAGKLVRAVIKVLSASEDPTLNVVGNFILVPQSQAFRDD